jgi:CBS domain-containing protein
MEIDATVDMLLTHKGASVWSVSPDDMVLNAIRMMSEKNVGALLVMDGEMLVGIISERDYTRGIVLKGKSSKDTPVREILSRDVVVAGLNDKLVDCMRKMTQKRVRHLPVLDGQKVVGVISIGDLVNWVISAQSAAIDQLQKYIYGE